MGQDNAIYKSFSSKGQNKSKLQKQISISILLICFCSFDLYSLLLDKDNFIQNLNIALSCPIK